MKLPTVETKPPKIQTSFAGYEHQIFPAGLDALNRAYLYRVLVREEDVSESIQTLAQKVSPDAYRSLKFSRIEMTPTTEDKYQWQRGAIYSDKLQGLELALLFPNWQRVSVEERREVYQDNRKLDRSIGLYVQAEVNPLIGTNHPRIRKIDIDAIMSGLQMALYIEASQIFHDFPTVRK